MENALSKEATDWREGRRHRSFELKQQGRLSLSQKTPRHASPATTGRYLSANPAEPSAVFLGL
jgi:hypothetical protein